MGGAAVGALLLAAGAAFLVYRQRQKRRQTVYPAEGGGGCEVSDAESDWEEEDNEVAEDGSADFWPEQGGSAALSRAVSRDSSYC